MNSFLKIVLPWAISLGVFFFVGFYLGNQNAKPALENIVTEAVEDNETKKNTLSGINNHKSLLVEDSRTIQTLPESNPPMPPNLQRIMQGGDIVERLGTYLDAVRSMDRSNVELVVKAFEELPSGYGRHLEMKLLMRSWANFDPEGALAYASNSLDAKSERRFGISEALAGWAVKDEQAAISWAQANHPGPDKSDNPLLVGIVKGLMETDLEAANRLFLGLPRGTARWQASSLLAEKFSTQGTGKAIQWAESYPKDDPRMRETILGQMGARLARQDLDATANWVKSMSDEPGAYRVMENLIHQWANQDPGATASWINELSDPKKRKHAMKELSGRWAGIDPSATADWLNSQPPSVQIDPAIASFVSRIQGVDPEGAVGWASSISDPALRDKSLKQALNTWQQTDPEKANQWLKKNDPNQK